MRSSTFITAMLAAAVSATPALKIIEEVVTKTVYVHPGEHYPTAAPQPVVKPAPKPAPVAKPAPSGGSYVQNKPKPQASAAASGNEMLDVANKWRAKYGLNPYVWDESLVDNCHQTGQQGNGKDEIHKLIPGQAMGQVIAPGQQYGVGNLKGYSPFEVVYLAWLCEVGTDPELQASENEGCSVCDLVQEVLTMNYGGETGHHDILVAPQYTKFACAFTPQNGQVDPSAKYQGLYVCDVAQ